MKGKKPKRIITALILAAIFSCHSLTLVYASNSIDESAIDPVPASYGYYVDTYNNNSNSNITPKTNPSIGVLSGFLDLWTPGSTWNNGTKINADILDTNIAKVVSITKKRTAADEIQAYLDARRNRNYSVINGLGAYTENFMVGTNAGTTISDIIPADAATVNYVDGGNSNDVWADETSSLGSIVKLVNTVTKSYGSTSPAKKYYKYMRPFYWSEDVSFVSTLKPSIKSDPTKDGGFPSGHTNSGYLSALILAYSVPERFQEMLTRASELGNNRIVAGVHSCFDVMGGRVMATAIVASVLNDPNNRALKLEAYSQAQNVLLTQAGTSTDKYSDYNSNKQKYINRLTYGFEQINDTTKLMVVPKGAEVLLETRFPYLDVTQRRWVLYSTGLPSGNPLLDDTEGWGRLNLFMAADGYGTFSNDVTVTMDASKGGYHARDNWNNDISGTGTLTKQGTGTLILSGNNTYTGGTILENGNLEAASSTAFGAGDVVNNGGTIIKHTKNILTINGNLTQTSSGTLELNIDSSDDLLKITGQASLSGKLILNFLNGYNPSSEIKAISFSSLAANTAFSSIKINGLSDSYEARLSDDAIIVFTTASVKDSVNDSINDSSNNTSSSDTSTNSNTTPKPSDISTVLIYVAVIVLCLICAFVVYRRNK